MSEFEDEVLADLGRYKETEEAVAELVGLKREFKIWSEYIGHAFFDPQPTLTDFLRKEGIINDRP